MQNGRLDAAMETAKPTLIMARWVCPMDHPPIRNGGVLIRGDRIVDVGAASHLKRSFASADVIDYGPAALLPGLINAHTHLELTNRPRLDFDGDIAGWLLRQRPPADLTPPQHQAAVESATRAGIAQCLRFGVTCVGDISQQPQWTRPILSRSPLRATSFGEVLGLGKLRERIPAMIERAADQSCKTKRVRIGISPHAPYTVEPAAIDRCVERTREIDSQLAMHIAEFAAEREFLVERRGPLWELWRRAGVWDDSSEIETPGTPPIIFADHCGLVSERSLLAHVNYLDDGDMEILSSGRASVVFCPRTHAYFRHPPHRWRDMLAAGVNVAVGTDSCASSPDLNVVDDLRLLRDQDPAISSDLLWKLITQNASRAMNLEDEIGSLSPGKRADVAVFRSASDDPLHEILDSRDAAIDLWIDGHRTSDRR